MQFTVLFLDQKDQILSLKQFDDFEIVKQEKAGDCVQRSLFGGL